MNIRKATHHDSEGLAMVHVNSWRTAYKGIIAGEYLSNLSIEARTKKWEWIFDHLYQDEVIYVIEEQGQIMGFIDGGKNREVDSEYTAEIYAFYLLQEVQGMGYGKRLFHTLIKELQSKGYDSLMVWVLERNPSIHFYEKLGGQFVTKKEFKIGEELFMETALGWKDLSRE
ncbi:N-acetyltransferase family protein [Paenibacillus marinisediminis]